ncbi:MAG: nitroreductase family protein [Lachnospiraceae bacterium]
MNIVAIMKERHSVRQYKNQVIDHSREEINAFVNAINAESKLVIQVFMMNQNVLILYGSWKFENVELYCYLVTRRIRRKRIS